MGASHLRAEKHTDKNGRAVTRHVRADAGASPAGGRPIPAPAVQPTVGTLEELAAKVAEEYPTSPSAVATQLVHLPRQLLLALHEAAGTPEAAAPLTALLRTVLFNLLRVSRPPRPRTDEMDRLEGEKRRLEVIATLAPFDSILEAHSGTTGNWNLADHVADALTACGLHWDDPLTAQNVAAAKTELLAYWFVIRPGQIPGVPESEWEEGRDWARAEMPEVERWLRPLALTCMQHDGDPHRWSDLQAAIDDARSSGCDPDALAAFMAERRVRDIAAAADALRDVHGSLQDGAL